MKPSYPEQVAARLIAQLEEGTAPWQRPWAAGQRGFMPMNPVTGKRYKGVNAVWLAAQGYSDPRWLTYKQAAGQGAQVQRGEKGTRIQYWKTHEEVPLLDDRGVPVLRPNGEPVRRVVQLDRPKVFSAVVFNAAQVAGLPEPQVPAFSWDPAERAELLLEDSGARIDHQDGDAAYYSPAQDRIVLPHKSQFPTAEGYYATALHELGHWTGHPSRLDRLEGVQRGTPEYAREELRAEIASLMLGDELAIGHDPGQHAAYVGHWIQILQEDPLELFRASRDALDITRHVLALERTQVIDMEEVQVAKMDSPAQEDALARCRDTAQRAGLSVVVVPHGGTEQLEVRYLDGQGQPMNVCTEVAPDGHTVSYLGEAVVNSGPSGDAAQQEALERLLRSAEASMVRGQETPPMTHDSPKGLQEQTYLEVPYAERAAAKAAGAKWDKEAKRWYAPAGVDAAALAAWMPEALGGPARVGKGERVVLDVPYGERKLAQAAGARWDKEAKVWFAPEGVNLDELRRFMPGQGEAARDPQTEFAEALKDLGLELPEGHPIMDGRKHRVRAAGDGPKVKPKSGSGMYVGFLEGIKPAGYAKNMRTQTEIRWKATGQSQHSEAERAELIRQAQEKVDAREREREALEQQVADKLAAKFASLPEVQAPTPYMERKGLSPQPGTYLAEGDVLAVPACDVEGKLWSAQYILPDGDKRFSRGGKRQGTFHVVGGFAALGSAKSLVVAEGYATAVTVSQALQQPVVCAFVAHNLEEVASALHTKFPDKPVLIAGDDDHHLLSNPRVRKNVGREAAERAAKATGGVACFPMFAPKEQAASPRDFTDWNDLAVASALGMESVRSQLQAGLQRAEERRAKLLKAEPASAAEQGRGGRPTPEAPKRRVSARRST